ncbi:methyl-accepting chemotaxis protein [Novispirillum itersonii]|uniref:Methyl-accepting chemotaxis protein n=1 Tax=Novispirillum itersonii TaxID=189 RepID=A0A7W9ZJY1_NOVIT|nr:methyl-accepting chemotaxis protein [Novispirillum itersonii]MBB6211619.1 methyl-accepting chemotaxis protein [Novispirillum itersonii]
MFKNNKIATKLLLLALLGILGVGIVTAYGLMSLRQTMEAERRAAVRQVVETAVSVATYYHKQAQDGALSPEEAKNRAAAVIRAYRYGQGDYMFVYSTSGVTEIHGTRKELEGKMRIDEKDATGFLFLRHQIENAKAGGGYTTYRFTKPGGGDALYEKVSYEALFAPWDWVIASGVYVDDIDTAFRGGVIRALVVLVILLVAMIGASMLLGRVISTPIRRMAATMRALAGGDLSVTVPALDHRDEIGEMANAVEVFRENARERQALAAAAQADLAAREQRTRQMEALMQDFDRDVSHILETVTSASTELEATARALSGTAEQSARNATTAAAATEQASVNVKSVAAASDELAVSITHIAERAGQSQAVAQRATAAAERTEQTVRTLGEATSHISQIVGLIETVASQTNLLALNATIEAARAGEAGKGFAVVANEVKSLANQTSHATAEISTQIAAMEAASTQVAEAIREIVGVIGEVNTLAGDIADAVSQQGDATREIARNVTEAAQGTQDVAESVINVTVGAQETGDSAGQVLAAAGELSRQSEKMRGQVGDFFARARAL